MAVVKLKSDVLRQARQGSACGSGEAPARRCRVHFSPTLNSLSYIHRQKEIHVPISC